MTDITAEEMARYLSRVVALRTGDIDWPACAPGMQVVYVEWGGDETVPEQEVADRVRAELEKIQRFWLSPRVADRQRQRRRLMRNPDSIIPPEIRSNTCRWEGLQSWATRTGADIIVAEVECSACHRKVAIGEAQTTVAIGVHGDHLPIPGYIHCPACVLRMDPTEAWLLAHAEALRIMGRRV